MSQPENYTAAQASDPTTSGQVLADIAALRPDLRPAVASNPSAYPGLVEWLKSLGEPDVDAAIAARAAAPAAAPAEPAPPVAQPTQPMPAVPGAPPAPSWAGQGGSMAPAPMPAAQPMPAQMPAPQPMPGPGYGAMPPQGYAGMPPQGYGGPPPKKSNKGLWIVLIIIGVLLLIGAVIFFLVKTVFDKAEDVLENLDPADAMEYGDNAYLDALYDDCRDGDWQACDDLFDESAIGSEYEAFGDTCGGQWEAGTAVYCVDAMSGDVGDEPADEPADDPADEPADDPGTDAYQYSGAELLYFEALSAACAAEDWAACDELYSESPSGSDYETFGDTCGDRTEGFQYCVMELGDGTPVEPMNRGDSVGLDALWDACAEGDGEACDLLYMNSPFDSEYEAFALAQD